MRTWEKFYAEHGQPEVAGVYREWMRNRSLFDETDGMGIGRDVEMALRTDTDQAIERLNEAEDAWEASGWQIRGVFRARAYRQWNKRRMDFFKAMYAENHEYRATLHYRNLDPDDDEAIADFLTTYRQAE